MSSRNKRQYQSYYTEGFLPPVSTHYSDSKSFFPSGRQSLLPHHLNQPGYTIPEHWSYVDLRNK